MKKKVLMILVLLAVIGTSAVFAQKAGDTGQFLGQTYRVESSSNGRLVLQLVPSLNGTWMNDSRMVIEINGNTGTIDSVGSSSLWQDAVKKGYVKSGDQKFRNIRSTGNLKWSVEELMVQFNTSNRNVATSVRWENFTYTISADGRTITANDGSVFTKVGIQQ